jgi:nucleoid-associated protein EbfC
MPSFQEYWDKAQELGQQMRGAQGELERSLIIGRSDDGTVRVVVSGMGKLSAVQVDPRVFELHNVQQLQDAIAQAIRAAGANAAAAAEAKMGPMEISLY